jgi:hypothetical protein
MLILKNLEVVYIRADLIRADGQLYRQVFQTDSLPDVRIFLNGNACEGQDLITIESKSCYRVYQRDLVEENSDRAMDARRAAARRFGAGASMDTSTEAKTNSVTDADFEVLHYRGQTYKKPKHQLSE